MPDERPAPTRPAAVTPSGLAAVTLSSGGVTADITRRTITPPRDSWYFPRYPGLTRIVPLDGLAAAIRGFVADHRALFTDEIQFGAWINPDSRLCYLDLITQLPDQAEAERMARRYGVEGGRKVVAIYNPVRALTVRLGGG
ncbi:hypothetical protein ACQHIV_22445 [Kribbella sp. GL6]|uniref:hypothetical protein n=1 Tax=Kribbella sp. GL6 TaxID=3419765 RepID=UPI003CFCB83A